MNYINRIKLSKYILIQAFSILLIIIFLKLVDSVLFGETLVGIDKYIAENIHKYRTPFLNEVFQAITFLGSSYFVVGTTILLSFSLTKIHQKKDLVYFWILLGSGVILNLTLKEIFQRPRPAIDALIDAPGFSFPSGHAMGSIIIFSFLIFLSFKYSNSSYFKTFALISCSLVILLVGFSRIYLGVHYLTDVVAGFTAGFWLFLMILFFREKEN